MSSIFHFKQFSIDQKNCAMKVNTDGVLLAALCSSVHPGRILDIGTGTGLISLMLAQRFEDAKIDAVEIDEAAAETAGMNFRNSRYSSNLRIIKSSIEDYFLNTNEKYDMIVSNPPFFINSLKSVNPKKEKARHTDFVFFENILNESESRLTEEGSFWLILPPETSQVIKKIKTFDSKLRVQDEIMIYSFSDSVPHRSILKFSFDSAGSLPEKFVIYEKQGVYSAEYRELLSDFLTIF